MFMSQASYVAEVQRQMRLAETDMRIAELLRYYAEHPEEWPACSSCGRRMHPTGGAHRGEGGIEFHCGVGGHAVTILYA